MINWKETSDLEYTLKELEKFKIVAVTVLRFDDNHKGSLVAKHWQVFYEYKK